MTTEVALPRLNLEWALYDADLRGEKGSRRQLIAWRELEWRRCSRSVAYFLETYGYMTDKDGSVIKWHLWPVQAELLEEWSRGDSTVAVKSRQLGITTLSAHFALWEVIFKPAVRWHAVSQNEASAKDLMTRLRVTIDRLPKWMIERARSRDDVPSQDLDNNQSKRARRRRSGNSSASKIGATDAITRFSCGLSELLVLTSTPESVQGKAGKFILDEFSKHKQQKRIYHLLLPAFDGGGQAIIIANGNGEDTFYSIYQAAKREKNRFSPHFYGWQCDPRRDQDWYESTKEDFLLDNPEADEYSFMAQYPSTEEEAFYITGNSRFKLSVINKISKTIREEKIEHHIGLLDKDTAGYNGFTFEKHRGGRLKLWLPPVPPGVYIIGVDPAGGVNDGDYATAEVCRFWREFKPESPNILLEQVAEYQAKVEPTYLSMIVERLGRWYNNAFIVVEKNNHGGTVLSRLKEEYTNLYQDKNTDWLVDEDRDRFGYHQSARSKAEMVDSLAEWLYSGSLKVNSTVAITEMARYEVRENGTTGAPKGMHDDLVVALGLCVMGARDRLSFVQQDPIELDPWRDW